ncbi:hypothetical protein [Micromonospora sp. NPDC005707]|uniref:hypothetical protein n=1 Tax=Micromonospora sp. NPDC005707 TaxID=3157050 RepID=UPI00340A4B9C
MPAYANFACRLTTLAIVALAIATALFAGQEIISVAAEGFGWGTAPATQVLAEGFGWGTPAPTSPGTWA